MATRRERRQLAADLELGRRHPYFYSASQGMVVAALVVVVVLVAGMAYLVAPAATVQVARWTVWTIAALALSWAFWYVGLRRR